jgi:hypothetical protein
MALNPANYPQPANGDILMPDGRTPTPTASSTGTRQPLVPLTPPWWLARLLPQLVGQARACGPFADFYEGNQPLAFASQKFLQVYGARFGSYHANFMPLVVDAERERLVVTGFRFGDKPEADKGVWALWQDNQMDAESQIAHEIALSKGKAYVAVDPFAEEPTITVEDPAEVIVESAPGNRRKRLAGLKVFTSDDGYARAILYLPDDIYFYRSERARTDSTYSTLTDVRWVNDVPLNAESNEFQNKLGAVPIVPLVNRPRRDGSGRSEIEPVMGNQLAINFLRYAALIGSDTAALPQRWAKNLDVQIDDATGKPKEPFRQGRDTLWATKRPTPEEMAEYGDQFPDTEFGQFPAASLEPYVRMIEEEIGMMASNSRTPYHYLLGSPTSVPPSGESLKSSEAPMVKKVEAQSIHFGEAWEEVMRLALIANNQRGKAGRSSGAETLWADAETRNEAARTDSILKQYQAGLLDDQSALTQLGYSPQEIERIMAQKAAEKAARAAAAPPPTPPAGPLTIGTDGNGNTVVGRQPGSPTPPPVP